MTMKRYLDKLSSDPSLPMNKAESKGPDLRKVLMSSSGFSDSDTIPEVPMCRYLGEFSFRSNRRHMKNAMFDLLIAAL